MNCPNCGKENTEKARFCRSCGKPLTAAVALPAQAGINWLRMPANWKMFLPLIGMGLVILGMVLPWLGGGGVYYSSFTVSDLLISSIRSMRLYDETIPALVIAILVAIWVAFVSGLLGHAVLWKHAVSRWITVIAGGVGLAMMITITVGVFSNAGKDFFSDTNVGAGFIITWIGFAVMVAGTILAWKDLEA